MGLAAPYGHEGTSMKTISTHTPITHTWPSQGVPANIEPI